MMCRTTGNDAVDALVMILTSSFAPSVLVAAPSAATGKEPR